MQKLLSQIFAFGIVGAIAFCIDYGLMIALTELAGLNYLLSATVSFSVSVTFNYIASMRFVFKHKDDLARHKEFVIFVVLSVIGLAINDVFMWLGVDLLHFDYRVVKIIVTGIVMFWNFASRKKFLDAG